MKQKLIAFYERYVKALRTHLHRGSPASLQPALKLGRQAAVLGVETLELARIHERALAALKLSNGKFDPTQRAEIFFTEAMTPIFETHRSARPSHIDLDRLNENLSRRTVDLVTTNRELQRGIVRRKSVAAVFKKNREQHAKLLKDSLQLQEDLRCLTRKNLSAQEKQRLTLSHQLQDEIAQTLLGIQVRLLTLKTATKGNKANLSKEIARTQRLVGASIRSINRFARKLNLPTANLRRPVRHHALGLSGD